MRDLDPDNPADQLLGEAARRATSRRRLGDTSKVTEAEAYEEIAIQEKRLQFQSRDDRPWPTPVVATEVELAKLR